MACFLDPVPFKFPVCFHLLDTIHPSPRYVPPTKSKPKASVSEVLFGTRQHVHTICKFYASTVDP